MSLELRKHFEELIPLTDEEFATLASYFNLRNLKKHQYLIQENEPITNIYFVTKGLLKASYIDTHGKEHIIQFAMENWWISDFQAFYTGVPSVTSIHCLEDVELYAISRKDLEKICLDNHKVEHFFRIKNSLGYVALQKRILSLLTTDARERFEQFSAQYPKLIQRVPKKIIASYLGVSRETLSRITRKL